MTPLVLGLGVPELLIILAVVLLLFGGARLAGLGKSTGRALRSSRKRPRSQVNESQQQPPLQPRTRGRCAGRHRLSAAADGTSSQPPARRYQQPPRSNQDPSGT